MLRKKNLAGGKHNSRSGIGGRGITIHSSASGYLTYAATVGDSADSMEMRYEDENIWLTDYRTYSDASKNVIMAAASNAGSIKAVLDTPILSEEGMLTPESEAIADKIGKLIYETGH